MARRVIGLDLGAYSVKLVRLEVGKQTPKFDIVTVVEEVLPTDGEGEPRTLSEIQQEALKKLAEQGFIEAEAYVTGLDALEGHMRTMRVPALDNRKIEAVLPGILETAVPFDNQEMIASWHRVEGDAKEEGREAGDGIDIRIAFGKKLAIAEALATLQPTSVDPRLMHLSAAAPFEIVRELGFDAFDRSAELTTDPAESPLSAVIDFGHRATSVCIFDKSGLKFTRSFLKGGKELTEQIALAFELPWQEAVLIKHNKVDLAYRGADSESVRASQIATKHFEEIFEAIERTLIVAQTSGVGKVVSIGFIGGACNTTNFVQFFEKKLNDIGIIVVPVANFLPIKAQMPSSALALAYALSGLQVHAKDSRFNFRKDEFAWRGEFDFIRMKSMPLILWALIIVCSLIVLWSASSLVLQKENEYLEGRLKSACSQILAQKNVAPKKCLTLMKEQISSHIDFGIPEFTALDIYLKTAELLPKELNVTFSELDVMEKKVRINAETASFADVDKVVASLSTIPCLTKIERGRAQQVGNVVKFTLSSDLDCNAAKSKPVTTPEPAQEPEPAASSKQKS